MARLRLFAGLRDAAGTGETDIDGETVGAVLEEASARFGSAFAQAMTRARVWVNGDEADSGTAVGPDDEVALIPPVSGGAGPMVDVPGGTEWLVALALGVVLIVTNSLDTDVWWAVAVIGVIAAWATDVAAAAAARARDVPLVPGLLSIVGMLVATRALGADGLGLGLTIAVVLPLAWAVASDESRVLPNLAASLVISVVSAGSVGSLLLARGGFEPVTRATGVFLAIAVAATVIGSIIERFSHLPFGDPFTATTLGAVAVSLIIAAVWGLDLVTFLIMGIVSAAGLIAGWGLGSLLRTQTVMLVQRPPGLLAALDGVVVAAALYLPVLRLVAVG